jgi:hypothetical protein
VVTLALGGLFFVGCFEDTRVPRSALDARRAELDRVIVAFASPQPACEHVGNIFADAYGPDGPAQVLETARLRLQLRALALGANYVQAPPAHVDYGSASIQGVAYRCPAPAPAVRMAVAAPVVEMTAIKPTDVVVDRTPPKLDGCQRADAVVVRNTNGSTIEAIEELRREASTLRTNYAHIVTIERPRTTEVVVNANTYRCPVR